MKWFEVNWSFWVLDTIAFVKPSLTALRVCLCFKAAWPLLYNFLNLFFIMLFLNFQLRLVGTALGIVLILGKLLYLHNRPWIFFFKLKYVRALHKGMQTESCFMIKAREHLTVSPESQYISALAQINGCTFARQDKCEVSLYTQWAFLTLCTSGLGFQ